MAGRSVGRDRVGVGCGFGGRDGFRGTEHLPHEARGAAGIHGPEQALAVAARGFGIKFFDDAEVEFAQLLLGPDPVVEGGVEG